MSVRLQSDSFIKCGKYNIIVIAVPDLESYDTSVIKIKNCAQIQLDTLPMNSTAGMETRDHGQMYMHYAQLFTV